MEEKSKTLATLVDDVKRLGLMYIENATYSLAEKISMLVSVLVIIFVTMLLGMAIVVFLAVGAVGLLEAVIKPAWSFIIVGGIMAVFLALLYLFRVKLVYDPVTRFVTRLLLNPPK